MKARCQSFLNTNEEEEEEEKKTKHVLGQALSPNYAPSRFYTRLYPYGLYIYIYLHVMAKRRDARRKMAPRFPSCSCLGSPVEFIGLLDEAITRVSSPPLGRG